MAASNRGGDDLPICVLQDLLRVAAFLARNPLHAAYALFFSRYIVSLAVFFSPLLVSTSLLVVVLVTAGPYVSPEWTGVCSLGRTCAIAVDALCAEVRSDGAGVELVAQICSFVLGAADGDGVLRVGEIMPELCFLLEEKRLLFGSEDCCKLGFELPLQTLLIREKIFSGHGKFGEIQHEIEDKSVVCEDLKVFKGSGSSSSETFVQKMEQEEDRVQNGSDSKRIECVPGSVEIKKFEQIRSHSSVSRHIRQWDEHVCRNFIQLPDETADNPLEFSLEKPSLKEMRECKQQQGQEFKDVKQLDTETSSEKCSEDQAEELSDSVVQHQQEWKEQSQDVQTEPELQEQKCKDVKHGQESEEQCHKDVQAEPELQEQEYSYTEPEEELQDQEDKVTQPEPELHGHEYKDADTESKTLCDDARDDSLKLTSIARCAHSTTSSENLVSEGSPWKEKEWKRTLACKLYEERMKLKVFREPAVVGCNDDMDMLWEAYEAAGSSDKAKGADAQEDFSVEGKNREGEEDDDEGSVRQLCCLQALNFSTRKMNILSGKPSLAKISKVLKRMTALSRIRSRRNLEG